MDKTKLIVQNVGNFIDKNKVTIDQLLPIWDIYPSFVLDRMNRTKALAMLIEKKISNDKISKTK